MKKISSFTDSEILNFILSSEKLSKQFEEYITENRLSYLSEKIEPLEDGLKNYNFSPYERISYTVSDVEYLFEGIKENIEYYSCSDRVQKLFNQCEKLEGTNLFAFYVEKLFSVYIEDEIRIELEDIERCGNAIYQKDTKSEDLLFIVSDFTFNCLGNIYVNNNNKLVTIQYL